MTDRTCTVEGCTRPFSGRGYCKMHLKRLARSGTLKARRYGTVEPCTVEGCDQPHAALGMCEKHWRRARKHGDPLVEYGVGRRPRPVEARFWEKVDVDPLGCWLWTASVNEDGYGQFMADRSVLAHRFAFELLRGPIPRNLELDHLCRVRPCVNPDHLEPVTHEENVRRSKVLTP